MRKIVLVDHSDFEPIDLKEDDDPKKVIRDWMRENYNKIDCEEQNGKKQELYCFRRPDGIFNTYFSHSTVYSHLAEFELIEE